MSSPSSRRTDGHRRARRAAMGRTTPDAGRRSGAADGAWRRGTVRGPHSRAVPSAHSRRAPICTRAQGRVDRNAVGVPVDISHAGLPFEARVIDRSTPFDIVEGAQFTTCSAEDPTAVSCIDTVLQKTTMFDSVLARGLMLIGTENARAVLEKMFMSDHDERHRIASDALVRFRQNGQ